MNDEPAPHCLGGSSLPRGCAVPFLILIAWPFLVPIVELFRKVLQWLA